LNILVNFRDALNSTCGLVDRNVLVRSCNVPVGKPEQPTGHADDDEAPTQQHRGRQSRLCRKPERSQRDYQYHFSYPQSNGLFHSLLSASYCNLWKTERKSDLDVVFSKGPADLLSSQEMQDLVAELRLKYDYIVVDASPAFELLGNTDDLRRRVAPRFTTTAFSKINI
jgi:hypothetical protein